MNLESMDVQDKLMIRSDGMFYAHMGEVSIGDIILKAEQRKEVKVFPFQAVASTPEEDREGEVLLQKGLNFEPFKRYGCFNWNHIPFTMVAMPTGRKAWLEKSMWMCEGEIVSGLEIYRDPITKAVITSDMIVNQHNTLKKAGYTNGLHVSVEGKATKRSKCGKFVEKADILHIALTFIPINPSCSLKMIAKSMERKIECQVSDTYYDTIKSMSAQGAGQFAKSDSEDGNAIETQLVNHLVSKGYGEYQAKAHVYGYLAKKFGNKK